MKKLLKLVVFFIAKKLIFLAVFLFLTHGVAQAAEQKEYIFILKALSNPYWQALRDGAVETTEAAGIKATILSPTNDAAKEEHLALCETALQKKPAFLFIGPATTAIGLECMKRAQEKGIRVADIDATVTLAEATDAKTDMVFTTGADNSAIGEKVAEYVANHTPDKPHLKVLVIEGAIGSPPGMLRPEAFKKKLKELKPDTEIVNSISGDWDRMKGMQIATDTLTRTPDLDVIFAANDMMAIGAAEAVKLAGKTEQVMVIGVDGTPDARAAILNGTMTASLTQLPYLIGKRAVEMAFETEKGTLKNKAEYAQMIILTKDVLTENKEPLLEYVR